MVRVGIAAWVLLAGCVTDADDPVEQLRADNEALTQRVEALETELQTVRQVLEEQSAALEAQAAAIDAMASDLEALAGLDPDALDASLSDLDARLATLEDAGLASEQWVLDQGYAAGADLQALDARVTGAEATLTSQGETLGTHGETLATQGESLATQDQTLGAHAEALGTHGEAIATLQGTVQDHGSTLSDQATRLAGHDDALADLDTGLADLADRVDAQGRDLDTLDTGLADLADRVDAQGRDLAALDTGLADLADRVDTQGRDLSTLADRVDANARAVEDLQGTGLHTSAPALLEYHHTAYDGDITAGRQGFQLHTNGGAFWLSGWMSATGFSSERVWWVTFYVDNPSPEPVMVRWNACGGDSPAVYVDGQEAGGLNDGDGACTTTLDFPISPGPHTVQIRYHDSNNWWEGLGVRNPWILDHGLEVDWEGLNAALAGGL